MIQLSHYFFIRAESSQRRMEDMKNYFTQMHSKLEASRKNLHAAQDRIERQNRIQATVISLKERANMYADKLSKQRISAALGADIPDFDFPQPLIDYKAEEEREQQQKQQKIEVTALQGNVALAQMSNAYLAPSIAFYFPCPAFNNLV